jgi:hypothetical protein
MDFKIYAFIGSLLEHVTAARNFTKHISVNKAFVCDETDTASFSWNRGIPPKCCLLDSPVYFPKCLIDEKCAE